MKQMEKLYNVVCKIGYGIIFVTIISNVFSVSLGNAAFYLLLGRPEFLTPSILERVALAELCKGVANVAAALLAVVLVFDYLKRNK